MDKKQHKEITDKLEEIEVTGGAKVINPMTCESAYSIGSKPTPDQLHNYFGKGLPTEYIKEEGNSANYPRKAVD